MDPRRDPLARDRDRQVYPLEPTLASAYRPTEGYDPYTSDRNDDYDRHYQVSSSTQPLTSVKRRQSDSPPPTKTKTKRISSPTSRKPVTIADPSSSTAATTTATGTGAKRAAQACLRCRRQKLRCLGGYPCDRCTKSKNVCDFGKPGTVSVPQRESTAGIDTGELPAVGEGAHARLEQLESSVANLLAGLAGGSNNGTGTGTSTGYPQGEILHSFESADHRRGSTISERAQSTWNNILPPPTHTRPVDLPRFGINSLSTSISPEAHVRFDQSPTTANNPFIPHGTSPSAYTSSGVGPSPNDGMDNIGKGKGKARGKGQKPEERLAAMMSEEQGFEPPFKALLHQVCF
jgi:hypothetical protein